LWTAVLSCCFAGPFVAFTFLRNHEWSDAYLLWDSAMQRSPDKMRVLHNFGVACFTRGELLDRQNKHPEACAFYEKADWAFSRAITIGEGKTDKKLFRPDEVVELKCFHLAYRNLAAMHLRRYMSNPDVGGREAVNRVETLLNKGLERTAYDPDLALCFAQFMMNLRRPLDALPILERSLHLHTWADHLWQPLGRLYLEAGNYAKAAYYLDLALRVKESNTVGVYWDPPAEHQAELYAFLGLAKLKQRLVREARDAFRRSLELDPQGVVMLLTMTHETINPKLKPLEMNPPDSLLIALSRTRRDVVQTLIWALDDLLKARPSTDRNLPTILRDAMQSELVRRDQVQAKRRQFGFTDDPEK
jgi:tetratricopeptide (TPR) repeat protein